jgi:hypothetical protein
MRRSEQNSAAIVRVAHFFLNMEDKSKIAPTKLGLEEMY